MGWTRGIYWDFKLGVFRRRHGNSVPFDHMG